MSNQTQITVTRTTSYADRLRAYQVKLDGDVAGSVGAIESVTIPLSPGRHSLVVRIDWCSSEKLDLEIEPGQHLSFECGSSLVGWRVLAAIFYVIFWSDQYLWLRRVSPSHA